MAEILSDDEIDQLLTAINSGVDGTNSRKSTETFSQSAGNKRSVEVLTQDEIDQLLSSINFADSKNSFESTEAFEEYLTNREHIPEKPYGIFDKDVSICRFFNSGKNENILEDIKS